jgi:hypothetical protein
MSEKITVEVITTPDGVGGRDKYIYQFEIHAGIWNRMDKRKRQECMRRKLWDRLACEYKVSEQE